MAVFSSGDSERTRDGGRGPRDSNLSIVATGMKVVGEVSSNGVIKVEGSVEGTVRADQQVLVAKDGVIEGDIYTQEAIIGGRVVGSIFADERVEVQPQSVVQGDIVTQRLVVQEGGEVNGNVRMADAKAVRGAHPAPAASPASASMPAPAD